jgi:LacI family transcriptional regulator
LTTSVTITQIAEAAGVSTATVDRVLNSRPGVNPVTVQRVRDAMKELGGAAPMRGRPRSTDSYRFAFVLPATRRGFFDQVDRVIAQAAGDFRHQHITEVTRRLPASDAAAFAQELAQLSDMDGVALLAPDTPPVKLAVNELVRAGVHVVTLFSDVAGSMRETFIGADNRAAGRTAGL